MTRLLTSEEALGLINPLLVRANQIHRRWVDPLKLPLDDKYMDFHYCANNGLVVGVLSNKFSRKTNVLTITFKHEKIIYKAEFVGGCENGLVFRWCDTVFKIVERKKMIPRGFYYE